MTFKHLTINTILLSSCLSIVSPAFAEPATLSNEFALHLPVIEYQNQHLWANLDYVQGTSGEVYFKLRDFGTLTDDALPPSLNELSQVTEGEPPRIVDISANDARLTFTSSIPLACFVVYGPSPAFGSVATDPNMNGGAIIEHNPILRNLTANTQYYYRVQGTDAQGKLYWQPVNTFTTNAADSTSENLLSLNNGAIISAVSSNFGGAANNQSWGANSAIDDSRSTAWSSAGDGDNAFIEVTLAQPEHIDHIAVWSRSMSDGSAKIFSFTISIDNSEVLGPFTLPDTQQAYLFPIDRVTDSLRLDVVSSSGGNTGLIEFSAYAADHSTHDMSDM